MKLIGTIWIGEYRIWSTPAFTPDHYEVLVVHEDPASGRHLYVNLMKDDSWKFLFALDEKNRPSEHTDMIMYQAYLDRKGQEQPLWKMSTGSLTHLLSCFFVLALDLFH